MYPISYCVFFRIVESDSHDSSVWILTSTHDTREQAVEYIRQLRAGHGYSVVTRPYRFIYIIGVLRHPYLFGTESDD